LRRPIRRSAHGGTWRDPHDGLLGGAIAQQDALEQPLFSQVLFGVYVGILAWGGLYLRDGRLAPSSPCVALR